MALFDAYIFVDWSAVKRRHPQKPIADAVWSAELIPQLTYQQQKYHRTRSDCISYIKEVLLVHIKKRRRVLIGFDFPYGYPAGFACALGLPACNQSWWQIWAEIAARVKDSVENSNNRFAAAEELNTVAGKDQAGPFWGCPVQSDFRNLNPTSPGFPFKAANGTILNRLRLAETYLSGTQEVWKLFGAGSVGGQTLVGIPYLYQLCRQPEFMRYSRVWPFETNFTPSPSQDQGPLILHAEIWPGVVKNRVQQLLTKNTKLIRDCAQVQAMCEWASELDKKNQLGKYFKQPRGLNERESKNCVQQEGWILGTY